MFTLTFNIIVYKEDLHVDLPCDVAVMPLVSVSASLFVRKGAAPELE